MVKVTILPYEDEYGKKVVLDFMPADGPYVRLTGRQWNQLLDEIDRIKRQASMKGNAE